MVWQDVFPNVGPKLDAEHERELRLVEQARAGADWALAALIARYQPPVTRYLTRLTGSPTKARILAEHVFIRMERRLHGSQGGRQLRLWLLRACTEAGLEMLRGPREAKKPRLIESRSPVGLLPSGNSPAFHFLRIGLGKLATVTSSTSRQVRQLIWSHAPESERWSPHDRRDSDRAGADDPEENAADSEQRVDDGFDALDPREALRHRMVRAVLAELPYGDAQCLALHLVAGLNQAEVALALGITASATRRRIVHGLTLFAQRYAAAAASLGLPLDFFGTPTQMSVEDSVRLNSVERSKSMVEAIADDLEVDSLTTNEHIAMQPFGHDDGALIWNGRIHNEMAVEAHEAATNTSVEAESQIVETSLVHIGEPVEVPEPVAALPPPPNVPLTVRDVWVQAEAQDPINASITLSVPLTLQDATLPARIHDSKLPDPTEDAVRAGQVLNSANDMSVSLNLAARAWNAVQANVSSEVPIVPILTASTAFDGRYGEAISAVRSAEYGDGNPEDREGALVPTRGIPNEAEDDGTGRGTRVVPVLTILQSPKGGGVLTAGEARVVPVLTSPLSEKRVTLPHKPLAGRR